MTLALESVPNFSEGRSAETIEALAAALGEHARLLDVHSDPDHNRSVFTLVGEDEAIVGALLAGIACAVERIDLRDHEGVHPRVGAADVVPLVPIEPDDLERAKRAALRLARSVGERLELPVFLYGSHSPAARGPAFLRRGGPEQLQRRIDSGELTPDFGPSRIDPAAGAVLVGARAPLIAFNVNLRTRDAEVAREIAALVRESGGGFPGVRALGLELPSRGLVQVSMNVEDWRAAPLPEIVARVRAEATTRNTELASSELVGLMPAGAAQAVAAGGLEIDGFDDSRVLESRLVENGAELDSLAWPRRAS